MCDKDGINAAVVFASMAAHYRSTQGMSVGQLMESLYDKAAGSSATIRTCSATTCPNEPNLRPHSDGRPRRRLLRYCGRSCCDQDCGCYNWLRQRLQLRWGELPTTPGSHMIMLTFDNGVSVTLRTSGTEPKIKFYTELAEGQVRTRLP